MVAEVILNSNAKQLNKVFDYEIPESFASKVMIGSRVFVPFSNRKELDEGYVVAIKSSSPYQLKQIVQVEDNLLVGEREISLANWMSKRYFCNVSDCIKLMLPPGTTTKVIQNRVKEKNASFVYLTKEVEEIEAEIANNGMKSEKQIRALRFLMENDGALVSDLEIFADVSRAVLKSLEKKGYIELIEKQVERNPFLHKQVEKTQDLSLNEEQQKAFATICEAMDDCFYSEFLLFGVTGSRKNRNLFTVNRKSFERRKI